jgi:hypothetical protein
MKNIATCRTRGMIEDGSTKYDFAELTDGQLISAITNIGPESETDMAKALKFELLRRVVDSADLTKSSPDLNESMMSL